ncbi:MAG: SdrD B-like domain-containing protein, partial [Planctomycetota bacterium]
MISDRLLSSRNRRRHRKLSHEQLEDRRVLAGVPGSIYGYVFEDLNADGIENPGEPRLNGITIDLMQTGGGTISTVTSDFDVDGNGVIDPATESGIYRFLDLIDGEEYQVLFPGVAGAFQTTTDPAALTATGGIAFVAVAGLSGTGSEVVVPELAIGISYLGSIHGFKFFDVNGDGIYDPAVDSGQPDVEFTLTGIDALGNDVDLSVQTDANGEFWFEQLVPSVRPIDPFPGGPTGYTVTETVPDGFVPTTPTSSTLNLFSRNELVWEPGAANLDPPPPPMIDQQQLVTSGGTQPVRDIVIAAQTFIPGIQGSLTDVDISVSTTAGVGDVTLEVRTVNDLGEPDAIIRSVTVPAVEVPLGDNQNLNFDFSADPAFLSLDTSYALVLTSATSAMSSLGWDRSTFSTYPDGTSYVSLDDGALWFSFPDMDQVFTTVMQGQGDPREEVLVGEALMFGNTSETGISSSIHGFKFLDLNGDGIYEPGVGPDGGERPMAGVEFTLTGNDVEGNPVDLSTMTDDTGQFWFTGLVTSEQGVGLGTGYTVTEIPPAGFGTTSPLGLDRFFDLPEGTELAWEEGAAMLPPGDPRVEVVVGDQLMWGNASLGSIHGFKFDDVNGNGIFDPGEGPRANVQFELTGTDAQGVPVNEIAVTDDTGQFWFTDLFPSVAGAGLGTGYTVTEIVESPFIATTPISRTFDLYSGQELVWEDGAAMLPPGDPRMEVLVGEELMFGNTTSASIHGFKFEDLDADGVFDPGEPALEGVEFQLTGTDSLGNVLNLMAFTDVNGEFWFEGLLPSVAGVGGQTGYTVTEVVPSGFVPTTTLAREFNLPSGVEYVWEAGAANLPDGDPRVEEVVGDALIWGNTVPGSIHGFKFIDVNGDGVYDPAVDTPQANVEFTLTGTDGLGNVVNQTMTTDDTGQFWFTDLIPSVDGEGAGTGYTVTEILPEGFLPTTALERFFNLTSRQELAWEEGAAMLPPGDPRMEVVVGEQLMWGNMPLLGQIHGYKFEDLNNDGVPDPGEPRLEGWEIQLLDDSGAFITSVLTDANGDYWFTELDPGTYFVREVQQLGWVQTTHNPPPIVILTDEVYVAELGQGMLGPEDPREEILEKCLIFGNRLTSSVHGYKFEDVNGNGVDDGEPRLAGVTITLTGDSDGDGLVETLFAVTDDNGEYWFEDLVFGTYTVDEVVPAGMVPTTSLPVTLTLLSGEEQVAVSGQAVIGPDQFETVNTDLAIGNAFYAAIHGYKFLDANRDGMDDGEPRLPGVTITLTGMDGLGQPVNRVTQTDVNGLYWFTDLLPGEYTVTETPPTGSIPTTDTFAEVTLESGEVEVAQLGIAMGPLGPGQFETENPALAFGNYYPGSIHGHKFEDINGDGVEDPGEPR